MQKKEKSLKEILFNRQILLMGLISLFTDISSEMLYPILPLYLESTGFSTTLIGLLEGLAEAVTSFSRGYFGYLSDLKGRRLPFIRLGYFLSNITRPMIGLVPNIYWIFVQRLGDKLGKGIRTGARDALLAESSPLKYRGSVFGFHRMMDTTGAILGPIVALFLLNHVTQNYQTIFLVAFIPGVFSVIFSLFLKEKKNEEVMPVTPHLTIIERLSYWPKSSMEYKKISTLLFCYALIASSQMFIILMLKLHGLSQSQILMSYIIFNIVYALGAYPMGHLSDMFGKRKIFLFGLIMLSLVYTGLIFYNDETELNLLMMILGLASASTEGTGRAWISSIVDKQDLAHALGSFSAISGIFALIGNVLIGVIWDFSSAHTAFKVLAMSAVILFISTITLIYLPQKR